MVYDEYNCFHLYHEIEMKQSLKQNRVYEWIYKK